MSFYQDPAIRRLIGRALTAGILAGIGAWQASDGTSGAITGVVVVALMAGLETVTPLNGVVGLFGKGKVVPKEAVVKPPAP